MRDYAYDLWLNKKEGNIVKKDIFVTAMDLDVDAHIDILSMVAFHTDMSCSKTINIPTEYPFEKTKEVYDRCHKLGIKGCTIFRPNPIRQGILITEKDKVEEEVKELKRGEWEEKPKGVIEIPRKIYTGCGKELLHITISPKEKRIIDFYITSSSSGGCKLNIQALAITMSGMLRLGGNIQNIKCAFRGMGQCPSFVKARTNGKHVSKGSSCPTAILNVLLEVQGQLENECLPELQELGYYGNKVVENKKEDKFMPIDLNNIKEKEMFTEEEKKFIKEYGESSFAQAFNKCPQCGEKIEHVGGCIQCMNCSYSKCE